MVADEKLRAGSQLEYTAAIEPGEAIACGRHPSHILSECPLFRDVPPHDMRVLGGLFRATSVDRGGFYFEQGGPLATVYILREGAIKISRVDREGREIILRIVNPPEPFGCTEAFSAISSDSAEALTDSESLMCHAAVFNRLIEDYPVVAKNALRLMSTWLRETEERLEDLGAKHVAQRVARALLRSIPPAQRRSSGEHHVSITLSHQDLAEIVGASQYTVSRVLCEWKRAGFVDVKRGQVIVHCAKHLVPIGNGCSPPER